MRFAPSIPRPAMLAAFYAAAWLAAGLGAAPGAAHARSDEPPGHARRQGQAADAERVLAKAGPGGVEIRVGAVFNDQHRQSVQQYYGKQVSQGHRCPPGLARKNNGCLPPGQARKFQVGQPLPSDVVWYTVPPAVVVRLPVVPPGYHYVRVGVDLVLLAKGSGVVVDVMMAFPL